MHPYYHTKMLFLTDALLRSGDRVQFHDTNPKKVVSNTDPAKYLGFVYNVGNASYVSVVLEGSDVVIDEAVKQIIVNKSPSPWIPPQRNGYTTTIVPVVRPHPQYGNEYYFDNPDKLTTGDYVQLVSGSWSAVELAQNMRDALGYIRVIVGGSGGRVLVTLNGSNAVLDDFVQRYKIAHPNITNPIAVPTGGIPAGGGSDGGTGGGGSVSVTLGKQSTDTILAGGGSGGGAGGGGLLDNDTFNKLIDHRAWIFPEWSCKCPYCPERPPTKHVKAPTCYTCGDKMSPV